LINIFEERVFQDTSYAICSFQFKLKNPTVKVKKPIKCNIYKNKKLTKEFELSLSKLNNYTFGGEIYGLKQSNKIKVNRLTTKNKDSVFKTNISLKCIDDSLDSKIRLSIVDDKNIYIDETPNLSARSYATLVIEPKLNKAKQLLLVEKFNTYLNDQRKKYYSLFLANYRESNTIARKRISFNLAFHIINNILSTF
jgi:hypothetical protein